MEFEIESEIDLKMESKLKGGASPGRCESSVVTAKRSVRPAPILKGATVLVRVHLPLKTLEAERKPGEKEIIIRRVRDDPHLITCFPLSMRLHLFDLRSS